MAQITPVQQSGSTAKQRAFKVTLGADTDYIDINIQGVDKLGLQSSGLSADTLNIEVSMDVDGSVFDQIYNEVTTNPFQAPNGTVTQIIEITEFIRLKITRSGGADGDIILFYTLSNI